MRQKRQTKTGPATPARMLALGLTLVALGAAPAAAEDGKAGNACSQRYHASLGRIAGAEYQALKAAQRAPGAASAAEPGLPGNLLFPPVAMGERTREETAALRFAASLARGKGRPAGATEADAAWMGDRLRTALGDYLTQSPSPYLCGGVETYVAELRGDARRLGPPPVQREALIAAQKSVAARAVEAALAAMKPVPLPGDKPADGPSGAPAEDLRPTSGLDRSIATGSTPPTNATDPDLPPLAPETPPAFETTADLVSAVDRLTTAARAGRFIAETPIAVQSGGAAPSPVAIPATTYPVLSRLAEIRPIVTGVHPLVRDRAVRLRLAAALSSIETLDYLMRSRTVVEDPLAVAIDRTFEAILKAHAADCTCRD